MGRSTETFSKKEREKKKSIKLKDKKEKAEDRKANAGKGKTLDEMMAYIDENGNITSTPPDPAKRKKIIIDDIQITYRFVKKDIKNGPVYHTRSFLH
jgi:hypothetical protein